MNSTLYENQTPFYHHGLVASEKPGIAYGFIDSSVTPASVHCYSISSMFGSQFALDRLHGLLDSEQVSLDSMVYENKTQQSVMSIGDLIDSNNLAIDIVFQLSQAAMYRFSFCDGTKLIASRKNFLCEMRLKIVKIELVHNPLGESDWSLSALAEINNDMIVTDVWSIVNGWNVDAYANLIHYYSRLIDSSKDITSEFIDQAYDDGLSIFDAISSYFSDEPIKVYVLQDESSLINFYISGYKGVRRIALAYPIVNGEYYNCHYAESGKIGIKFAGDIVNSLKKLKI
jgi:hypothetical protein